MERALSETQPDQTDMWNAYGHAMAAATGLDMAMRFAIYAACDEKYRDEPAQCDAAKARHRRATFGKTAKTFCSVFEGYGANAKFTDALDKAVEYRNMLAHHFLERRMLGIQSDKGLQVLEFELRLAIRHFNVVEIAVRKFTPFSLSAYIVDNPTGADHWAENHPLNPLLEQFLSDGEVPIVGLDWWDGKF